MDKAELGLYELLIERLLADDAVDDAMSGLILAAVHVEGFRGIGRPATLQLAPGPGLTLVTGRNGSGKSSFAEAAELVMTGRNERWSGRTAVWRDGWRNLHSGDDASVAADLTVAGTNGTTKVQRRWAPEDKLEGGRWIRQEPKAKVQDFDGSAWGASMQTYRPFLSYSELGALIDGKPTELHDAVHDLLGLGALTAAHTRLKAARKPLADRARDANAERKAIRNDLAAADDPRIVEALALLKSTSPDLGRIAGLLSAAENAGGSAAGLRAVLDLRLPSTEDVRAAAERIRAAVDAHTAVASAESSRADLVARLLREALHVHTEYGSTTCLLCEQGTLDDAWRASATTRADQLERSAAEVRRATSELAAAVAAGRSLVHTLPAVLTGRARETWQDWVQAGRAEGPAALAQGLETTHPVVAATLAEARTAAEAELARRDEVWAPVVRRLGAYHDAAAEVAAEAGANATLTRAEKWLADTANEMRSQRLAPFAEQSQHVWQALRQQSNVGLGAVRLAGANNQRRVAVDVSIDGVDGGAALGVMSQGELHALGLALFLPRATVDQSPFRFIVIDDPVQAMDPAKVDGLARVLAEVALTRQVVVFTHDDRLADAVRRLELPATIWEVVRGERSAVEMRRSDDPVARYLDDAKAMASTEELPPDIRSELVASCCRSAVEAACHSKIRSVRLAAGHTHADVELLLKNAETTNKKATLAVFDDPKRGSDLLGRIKSGLGPDAVDAFQKCKKGAHKGLVGDLHPFIKDVKKLAEWLQK